jgi:membrane protease subunit HflK
MPWNNDGPGSSGSGPWGAPPPKGERPRPNGGGPNRPNGRPGGPWGPNGPGLPDFDGAIAAAQAWVRRFGGRGPGGSRFALLGVAVVVALWLLSGFYRVQPDEEGVVMRFGAFVRTTQPGLNYRLPWPVESVEVVAVTRINRTDIGYRPATNDPYATGRVIPGRDVPEEGMMLTGDENIIDINFAVFWRIRNVGDYLFNTRNPDNTVKDAAESVMREVIGSTPIQPALAEARGQIEGKVMTGTQAILDAYKTGVDIIQVQLQRVDPPAAVIDSFRDVQRANTDAERLRNEAQSYANDIVPRARGDAARVVAEAEGARAASIAQATGQAQRFESVLAAYQSAKDVTLRRLYIETMQDILAHSSATVVDDRLKGLVPLLSLGPASGSAAPPMPASPQGAAR